MTIVASENYKQSRMYKSRYKNRLPPTLCSVIRNNKQCGNWAIPGMKCCSRHGGKAAKKNIKHGANSKSLKINIMYFLNSLTNKEKKAVENGDYSTDNVLDNQIKLTDILLFRAIEYLNQLQGELEILIENIELSEGSAVKDFIIQKDFKQKAIVEAHKIINLHQKTKREMVETRDKLSKDVSASEKVQQLAASLEETPLEMLAESINACISAGILTGVEDLKLLIEAKEQETIDIVAVAYEYEQD